MITTDFDKRFAVHSDFDFFNHPVYPYELKEDLIVRFLLNSSEKVIFCGGDTAVTYTLSEISLEHDAIFDEPYAVTIDERYAGKRSIPYSKRNINQQFVEKPLHGKKTLATCLFVHY